jgi:transposase
MCVVGIDVSSTTLDYSMGSAGETRAVDYSKKGLGMLVRDLKRSGATFVVMEASGGYERRVRDHVHRKGFDVAVVNARQIRDFARAMNQLAKTDTIDSTVIARFGEVVELEAWTPPSAAHRQLTELVIRRSQLVEDKIREQNRAKLAQGAVLRCIKQSISFHNRRIKLLEKQIAELIADDDELSAQCQRLCSVPGIAVVTASAIMAHCRELGQLKARAAAKLAGVAPFANESGQYFGKRSIRGGRSALRKALYMSALVGTRCNQPLSEFYQRGLAKGKPKKVALVACMNKLIRWLNAMERDGLVWSQMEMAKR